MVDTKEYIKYIKSQPCLICGINPVDPDHLQARGMGGLGKPGTVTGYKIDFTCIPLCREHHTERHSKGTRAVETKYKINLWKEAFLCLRRFFIE
jgi:hypothetical protein